MFNASSSKSVRLAIAIGSQNGKELSAHRTDYHGLSRQSKESEDDRARRQSFIEEDLTEEDPLQVETPLREEKKEAPVTWMSLPRKGQLAILVTARLCEPLVQSSLRSYLFYQLKSFDKSLPDSTIASQAGLMQGAFAAAQLCTAMLWGRWSDQRGRKKVILIGLFGTMISCLGFGFSRTFWQAMIFRMMGGALNGNVGVMRTMVSEIVKEKKSFLLLPMCANIGVIIGPILGGLTSDPVANYPKWFGGIKWLERFPYSPPNILSAVFLFNGVILVFFGLEETHQNFMHKEDFGIKVGQKLYSFYRRLLGKEPKSEGYTSLATSDLESPIVEMTLTTPTKPRKRVSPQYRNHLQFRRIFTYNVVCTLVSRGLLAFCSGAFQSIWYSFLSTPVYDPATSPPNYHPHLPFIFTGGVGLPPRSVGIAMAILGLIGITMQLFLYPWVSSRLGTIASLRIFLCVFPIVFALIPYLAIIPSTTPPPSQKTGSAIWATLIGLLFLITIGRTFAPPASTILVNNCSPHPTVLGTIHGIGQSVGSAGRTIAPSLGGWLYGFGLENGSVGAVFWGLAVAAGITCFASSFVREGDGHEIRLEGDDEAEEEAERANRGL